MNTDKSCKQTTIIPGSTFPIKEGDTILTTVSLSHPWRFKRKDGAWVEQTPELISCKESTAGDIKATCYRYKAADHSISGIRICIEAGDHACFFVDQLTTDENLCVYTDFCLNNAAGDTWCNIADKNKLVARASLSGMKHFYLQAEADGQDILPKSGLLMPYKIDDNKNIHYSMYEGLYSYGNHHLNLFGFCHTNSATIKRWHFTLDNGVHTLKPSDQSECWCVELQDNTVKVYNKLQPSDIISIDILF